MRGKKAKMIRKAVRSMVQPEAIGESTGYEVISHPPKRRMSGMTGQMETYNPRQVVVKSMFRRMALDVKREYKLMMRAGITTSFVHNI